jgi:hypothetical protein
MMEAARVADRVMHLQRLPLAVGRLIAVSARHRIVGWSEPVQEVEGRLARMSRSATAIIRPSLCP